MKQNLLTEIPMKKVEIRLGRGGLRRLGPANRAESKEQGAGFAAYLQRGWRSCEGNGGRGDE